MNGYLALTRHQSEKIIIKVDGREIEILVASIRGDRVMLALRGDDDVKFIRAELLQGGKHGSQQGT